MHTGTKLHIENLYFMKFFCCKIFLPFKFYTTDGNNAGNEKGNRHHSPLLTYFQITSMEQQVKAEFLYLEARSYSIACYKGQNGV